MEPVTAECPDHWHCDPTQAAHGCTDPDPQALRPGGFPMTAPLRPVTGPDGDNQIADEQIRDLLTGARRRLSRGEGEVGDDDIERAAFIAFDRRFGTRRREDVRRQLAAAYNARHGAGGGA